MLKIPACFAEKQKTVPMSCRKYTYIKPIGLDHDGLILRPICWDIVRCDGCRLQVGGLRSLLYRSESFVSKSQMAVKRKSNILVWVKTLDLPK